MNFPFAIARRYFIARRSSHIIHRIARITVAGITVGTMALIIVLSAFNGLDHLIRSLFKSFDPDIRIMAVEGKSFRLHSDTLTLLGSLPGVALVEPVAEDNAMLMYQDRQAVATLKGVSMQFAEMTGIDSMLTDGEFKLYDGDLVYGIIGTDIAWQLGIGVNFVRPVHLYVPRRTQNLLVTPEQALNHRYFYPSGIFSIQQDYDSKYVLIPFDFARELFDYADDEYTAIEIKLRPRSSAEEVKEGLGSLLGSRFRVETAEDLHAYFYRVMKAEKWAIFLILGFILIIASFNSISSLTLLMMEKKTDSGILRSLGATQKQIRQIFQWEGLMITLSGMLAGMVLGAVLCWLQMHFGIVRFPQEGSFVVNVYPLRMVVGDFLLVAGLVGLIGLAAARIPLYILKGRYFSSSTEE